MFKKIILLFLTVSVFNFAESKIIRKISVTGNVEREIMPDMATLSFKVESEKENLNNATNDVEDRIKKFKNDLNSEGIKITNFETISSSNKRDIKYVDDEEKKKKTDTSIPTGVTVSINFLLQTKDFEKVSQFLAFSDDVLLRSIKKNYTQDSFSFRLTDEDKTLEKALSKVFSKFNDLKSKLLSLDINNNITLENYEYHNNYNYDFRVRKDIFNVSNNFRITTKDLKKLNTIIELANKNSIYIVGSINFGISNKKEIESDMYNEAFNQSQAKAMSILKSSVLKLGEPIVVSEDISFQNKMIEKIDQNWTIKEVEKTNNYSDNVVVLGVSDGFMEEWEGSTKTKFNLNKIEYKPKPITITQDISVLYEMK